MATTELSAETRSRILAAAWERAVEQGPGAVSVKAVAADAGVSRQLVYFHFTNRAGLLLAMARHHDTESGFRGRAAADPEARARRGFEALLREWCAYLPALLPVARALEAAAITGDEGGLAWEDRIGELREAFRLALERLAAAGRLASGWTVDAAAAWACAHVQPATWAQLVELCRWSPDAYTERTVGALSISWSPRSQTGSASVPDPWR